MRTHLFISLFVFVSFSSIQAQWLKGGAAVDAKGVRHVFEANPTKPSQLVADTIKREPIVYPYEARKARREGTGLFRLHIDLATGKVNKVTILKSTGTASLDNSAVVAFRQNQFKPGIWKEVDLPVNFA